MIIRYNANGSNVTNIPENDQVSSGSNYTISSQAPERVGYDFICWTTEQDGNGDPYEPADEISSVTTNVELYAQWSAKSYTVTTEETNGSLDVTGIDTNDNGEFDKELVIEAVSEGTAGYSYTNKLIKIYHTSSDSEDNLITTLTDDGSWTMTGAYYSSVVIVLSYDKSVAIYEIEYELNGGSFAENANQPMTHTYNTATPLVNPSKEGSTFAGWFTNSNLEDGAVAKVEEVYTLGATDYTSNIKLYAKWASSGYTLVTNVNDITTGEYIIAAKVGNNYYAIPSGLVISSGKFTGELLEVSDNIATDTSTNVVTIIKNGNNYNIKVDDNKYIKYVSSTNLALDTAAYNWSLSINNDGTASFRSTASTDRGLIFRAGSTNKFGGYSSSNVGGNEYYDVVIFKK